MQIEDLAPWLFSRTAGGIRWGLERTRELLAGVGDPHRLFRPVHVGGTNGKGSVAAMTAAALQRQSEESGGAPIGLYTSPHLISFSERIRIGGEPAPDELILAAAERLRPQIDSTGATFFEATTAIAFLCFAEAGVRTAVVEVGLGGRLDATNVIDPVACAITNVSLEHTEYLGDTLTAIAREKAGILKAGVPAITGVQDPEVLAVLRASAEAVGAPLRAVDELACYEWTGSGFAASRVRLDSGAWGPITFDLPLPGEHQARNLAIAAELLASLPAEMRPSPEAMREGIRALRWTGRLQVERIRGTTWVLDVAHNPAGAETLARTLDGLDLPHPRVLVFGVLADKDWATMLGHLLPRSDGAVLTVPASSPAGRAWDPAEGSRWAAAHGFPATRVIPGLPEAIQRASTMAPHGTVIVTGSFHTVGEAMAELGLRA